jgi:hypothetical protein
VTVAAGLLMALLALVLHAQLRRSPRRAAQHPSSLSGATIE